MSKRRYVEPRLPEPAELDAALDRDDAAALCEMVIAVTLLGDDGELAMNLVRRLIIHENDAVRANAVLGVAHIARRFGWVAPDLLPNVREAAADPSFHVRGQAETASDDLKWFLGIDVSDAG